MSAKQTSPKPSDQLETTHKAGDDRREAAAQKPDQENAPASPADVLAEWDAAVQEAMNQVGESIVDNRIKRAVKAVERENPDLFARYAAVFKTGDGQTTTEEVYQGIHDREVAMQAEADSAAERIERLQMEKDLARKIDEQELWKFYRKVLLAPNPPTEEETRDLLDVAEELGISSDEMAEDFKLVAKARKHEALADQRQQLHEDAKAKRETWKKVQAENELREIEARRALGKAEARHSMAMESREGLANLARQRPQLFDTSVHPPRLLPAEPNRPSTGTART